MRVPLEIYLDELARSSDPAQAVIRVAEALADYPWSVVEVAGFLAGCDTQVADRDLGLTRTLEVTAPSAEGVIAVVDEGQAYPVIRHRERRARSVVNPPVHLARQVVRSAMSAVEGPVLTGLDLACGSGAFLLALVEAGVQEVYGTDLDPLALEIAHIAVPTARLLLEDPLKHGPWVDLVVGASPFLDPERVDARYRWELQRRYPWLRARFDIATPHAAAAVERARPGGAVGLLVPSTLLFKHYSATLRRRWLQRHRFVELAGPQVLGRGAEATVLVLGVDQDPGPLPVFGMLPEELLALRAAPIDADLMPGDVDLVRRIRASSVPLGSVANVDSGIVLSGPEGGGERVVFEEPGEDRVPFADSHQFFTGQSSWLDYQPARMHKCKPRSHFETPKVVIQRLRGKGPIRAGLDYDGVFLDHTCTLVKPHTLPLGRVLELVRSPWLDAMTRIEHGDRFDLYPREVERFPVPKALLEDPDLALKAAWGLTDAERRRLEALARR